MNASAGGMQRNPLDGSGGRGHKQLAPGVDAAAAGSVPHEGAERSVYGAPRAGPDASRQRHTHALAFPLGTRPAQQRRSRRPPRCTHRRARRQDVYAS